MNIFLEEDIKNTLNNSGVYCIVFNNSKFYIGRSNKIRRRLYRHVNECNKNKHPNSYLQNSYLKHGIKYICIYYCLNTEEIEGNLLNKFYGKLNCVNLSKQTKGGYSYDKNHPRYKEICNKISLSNTGRKMSKEAIEKMVYGRKDYITSEETKHKISKACSGSKNGMYNKKHSKDSLQKMIKAKTIYTNLTWLNLDTGECIINSPQQMKAWGCPQPYHVINGRCFSSKGWVLI